MRRVTPFPLRGSGGSEHGGCSGVWQAGFEALYLLIFCNEQNKERAADAGAASALTTICGSHPSSEGLQARGALLQDILSGNLSVAPSTPPGAAPQPAAAAAAEEEEAAEEEGADGAEGAAAGEEAAPTAGGAEEAAPGE